MTEAQRLALARSKTVERMNALQREETLDDSARAELDKLGGELDQIEVRWRAAARIEAASVDETRTTTSEAEAGSEQRALDELERRTTLAAYVGAAVSGGRIEGAEAELNQHLGLTGEQVPLTAVVPREAERRAAAVPGDAAGAPVAQRETLDRLFYGSDLDFLGIRTEMVPAGAASFPVISQSGPTADFRAAGADSADQTLTITAEVIEPKRYSVKAKFQLEQAAVFIGLEEQLRRDLAMAMATHIDDRVINSTGASGDLDAGLLSGLAPSNQTAQVTYDSALTLYADRIDGYYANSVMDVRLLVGLETARNFEALLRGAQDGRTVGQWARENTGGLRASGHLPVKANKRQSAIACRGMDPGGAVLGIWSAATLIRDPYSDAGRGEVSLTLTGLAGLATPRLDSYAELGVQLDA